VSSRGKPPIKREERRGVEILRDVGGEKEFNRSPAMGGGPSLKEGIKENQQREKTFFYHSKRSERPR